MKNPIIENVPMCYHDHPFVPRYACAIHKKRAWVGHLVAGIAFLFLMAVLIALAVVL